LCTQATEVAGVYGWTWASPWRDDALSLTLRRTLPTVEHPKYTSGALERRRVNLGTVARMAPEGDVRQRRRTWTHLRPLVGRGAHAVEFSKTVASSRGGFPLENAP